MLTPEEVKSARYRIKAPKSTRAKNENWLRQVHKRDYTNQKYLEKETWRDNKLKKVLYGLEGESVSGKRLAKKLEKVMVPLLGKSDTIMDQDIIPALEKHLGKRYLTWQETVKEIIRQNPADLGKISKAVNDYIESP